MIEGSTKNPEAFLSHIDSLCYDLNWTIDDAIKSLEHTIYISNEEELSESMSLVILLTAKIIQRHCI